MNVKISFLMPAYNNEATIGKSIDSILSQKTSRIFEIIVVDDGSTDSTFQIAQEFLKKHSNITVIKKQNGGEASALNEGLKYCRGHFIALVEADVEIEEIWIEKSIKQFTDKDIAGVGGRLVTPQSSSWIARIAGYEVEGKFETKGKYTRHITSANALYRAEIFKEIGNFNEHFVNAVLDSDFNRRVTEKGYKLIYVKDAVAFHHFKPTFKGYLKRQYAYARYRVHERIALYPADRFLAGNVLICGLSVLSLVLLPWHVWLPVLLLSLAILLQIPATIRLWKDKKDPILSLYPFIIVLRNVVGMVGYGIGIINKGLKRY
jgi:glycosyltransferase involved in cell wall biosynthesis